MVPRDTYNIYPKMSVQNLKSLSVSVTSKIKKILSSTMNLLTNQDSSLAEREKERAGEREREREIERDREREREIEIERETDR